MRVVLFIFCICFFLQAESFKKDDDAYLHLSDSISYDLNLGEIKLNKLPIGRGKFSYNTSFIILDSLFWGPHTFEYEIKKGKWSLSPRLRFEITRKFTRERQSYLGEYRNSYSNSGFSLEGGFTSFYAVKEKGSLLFSGNVSQYFQSEKWLYRHSDPFYIKYYECKPSDPNLTLNLYGGYRRLFTPHFDMDYQFISYLHAKLHLKDQEKDINDDLLQEVIDSNGTTFEHITLHNKSMIFKLQASLHGPHERHRTFALNKKSDKPKGMFVIKEANASFKMGIDSDKEEFYTYNAETNNQTTTENKLKDPIFKFESDFQAELYFLYFYSDVHVWFNHGAAPYANFPSIGFRTKIQEKFHINVKFFYSRSWDQGIGILKINYFF